MRNEAIAEASGSCFWCSGEFSVESVEDGPNAFRVNLNLGLTRTNLGARVFGALKGAVDGSNNILDSVKCFPGYNVETKTYNAEVHCKHIVGGHVVNYMKQLHEQDEEAYQKQFSRYIKLGITADDVTRWRIA